VPEQAIALIGEQMSKKDPASIPARRHSVSIARQPGDKDRRPHHHGMKWQKGRPDGKRDRRRQALQSTIDAAWSRRGPA
jgi:hypothetical protein